MKLFIGVLPHIGCALMTVYLYRRMSLTKGHAPTAQAAENRTPTIERVAPRSSVEGVGR